MPFFYFSSELKKTVPIRKASILTSHRWMPATLKLSVGKLEGQSESVFDHFFSSFIPFESRVCWSLFLNFFPIPQPLCVYQNNQMSRKIYWKENQPMRIQSLSKDTSFPI